MPFLSTEFVFSKAPRYRLARHATFWGVWALFFAVIYGTRPHYFDEKWFYVLTSYTLSFLEAVIYMPNHMLISYGIIYVLMPRYLFKGKYLQLLLGLVLLVVLVQVSAHQLTVHLVVQIRHSLGLPAPMSSFYYSLMAGLRGGVTVAGFAAAIKLMKYWYQKQQDNQMLIQKNLESELKMLKAQVHPHFLFNTLNNLYALTLENSPKSPDVVLRLSALLNYMLYECNAQRVSLRQELDLLQHYIALEKIRYEDRIDIFVQVTGEVEGKAIAPLLLLPFLENSFKHGTSEQLDQAWIGLDLSVTNETMKMKLINSKNPTKPSNPPSEGIGLQNVRKRLELMYADRHELRLVDEEETFMVILTLQLEESPPVAAALASPANQQPVSA